ncbi:MAG TPA: phage tail assembly chaperone [Rhabdaerophilum sp.]|nr:phage tail assembly chaperone [Rhabdaerophilum sp.]
MGGPDRCRRASTNGGGGNVGVCGRPRRGGCSRKPSLAAGAADGRRFPWAEIVAFGLGTLRLHPDAFWSLSLPELTVIVNAALGRAPQTTPMFRDDLAALIARYPDRITQKEE